MKMQVAETIINPHQILIQHLFLENNSIFWSPK